MLRAVRDREVAKEAARVNVSALVFGQARIVPLDGRVSGRPLQNALGRDGEHLAAIRRAVSHLVERAVPASERLRLPVRDVGPER